MAEADTQGGGASQQITASRTEVERANHPDVKDEDSILKQLPDPVTTVWNYPDTVGQVKARAALGQRPLRGLCLPASKHSPTVEAPLREVGWRLPLEEWGAMK